MPAERLLMRLPSWSRPGDVVQLADGRTAVVPEPNHEHGQRARLVAVARRLDHEINHAGRDDALAYERSAAA